MANYYYFLSTLPWLRVGEPPPLTGAEFIDQCMYQLEPEQTAVLAGIALEPEIAEAIPDLLRRWYVFETTLRNLSAQMRAARLKIESQPFQRPGADAYGGLEAAVQDALNRDPLAMEQQLDRLRWQFLDQLGVGHDFDFDALIVYRLRLLLLEKRSGLTAEAGRAAVESFLNEKLTSDQLPEFIHG